MRRLILRSFQSSGDIDMLTAAVRDLHLANPGQFQTDVRTSADALWENNPYLTPLVEGAPGVEVIDMHYPLVHQSQRPFHFIHAYAQYLEERLGVRVPVTRFCGDIHLSAWEKSSPPLEGYSLPRWFWILIAGGKFDFTAKWPNPYALQKVVDYFEGRIRFIQCGERGHWHPPLNGVINLVGKTTTRQFVRLMHYAFGVVCPVTFAMHLAASVETRPGRPRQRPCVVIAGAREPTHWEAYPHHQYISTVGMLSCGLEGCWRSRCQLVGDGDQKDHHDVCEQPIQITPELRIAKCIDMISADDVIRRIEMYFQGGVMSYSDSAEEPVAVCPVTINGSPETNGPPVVRRSPDLAQAIDRHVSLSPTPIIDTNPPVLVISDASRQPHLPQVAACAMPHTMNGTCEAGLQPVLAHPPKPPVSLSNSLFSSTFYHGLGDCSYFAHMIPLYIRRGYSIEVECNPDKALLFEAAGATTVSSGARAVHHWGYPSGWTHVGQGHFWQGSKMGHNLSEPPLPVIGNKSELWDEYVASRVDIASRLSAHATDTVDRWLEKLPRPVVLFHSRGNTSPDRKSLPNETSEAFYHEFIDRCEGTLILLDWDNRVPRLASARVRHLSDLGTCSTETMLALMLRADLIIGVDSGPLHCARFTNTPTLGIWMPGHYPSTYSLPRREQVNVVLADHTRQWNRFKRIPWNIVEHPGSEYDARRLADLCGQMLAPPRYLDQADIAPDLQLQQFVREFCRWRGGSSGLATYWDRNRSFDVILRELTARFPDPPTIIETGTIRSEEDWAGAGFATYLFGTYLYRRGGQLHSVDVNPSNVSFARTWTELFGKTVTVHERDSLSFLTEFPGNNIDLAYFDSLDTTEPNHAEHAFRELELVLPKLNPRSLVVFDDTPWNGGAFTGKGELAVPWLLEKGWHILYAGYQVVLAADRSDPQKGVLR